MEKEMLLQPSLEEAVEKCITEDALITSDKLDEDESIHFYNGALYYEDGVRIKSNIRSGIEFLKQQEWTHNAKWYVLGHFTTEQMERLERLHKCPRYTSVNYFETEFKKIIKEC